MIRTIKEYCDALGVTRQYVGEYIKKGKIPAVELPIFAEYGGQRYMVGHKTFVVEEAMPTAEMDKKTRARHIAARATGHLGIRTDIERMFLSNDKDIRQETDARYAGSPEAEEYKLAMAKVQEMLFEEAHYMLKKAEELLT